jgi:hypothetical protein
MTLIGQDFAYLWTLDLLSLALLRATALCQEWL